MFRPRWRESAGTSIVPLLANKAGLLIVAGFINGAEGHFIVDTGASTTIISTELARRLGLSVQDYRGRTNLEQPLRVTRIGTFALGEESWRRFSVVVLDLSHFSVMLGAAIDGIVGVNLLKGVPFTIDVSGSCLSLNTPDFAGTCVPIALEDDRVYVDARVDDLDVRLALDSGATSTCIGLGLWTTLSQSKRIETSRAMRADADSTDVLVQDERIPVRVTIGGGPSVDIRARHCTSDNEHLLGLDFLAAYVVGFDLERRLVYWDPAAKRGDQPAEATADPPSN